MQLTGLCDCSHAGTQILHGLQFVYDIVESSIVLFLTLHDLVVQVVDCFHFGLIDELSDSLEQCSQLLLVLVCLFALTLDMAGHL